MTLDLNNLDTSEAAESGSVMEILHPKTGEVIKDDDGTPWTITLLGMDSRKVRAALDKAQDRRIETSAKRRRVTSVSSETLRREETAVLVAATVSWHLRLDGEVPECTEERVRKVYDNPGWQWLRDQVDSHLNDRDNYLGNSSTTS